MATDLIYKLKMNKSTPPEKKPSIEAARERIQRAKEVFQENFDDDGKPTSRYGRNLVKKYYEDTPEKAMYDHQEPDMILHNEIRLESPEQKRQYVLEKALQEEIARANRVFYEIMWRFEYKAKIDTWGPDEFDDEDRDYVPRAVTLEELQKAKACVVGGLENLLKSVIMTYNEDKK